MSTEPELTKVGNNSTVSSSVEDDQARILYMQAPISNVVVFLIALIFFFLLRNHLDFNVLLLWVAMLWLSASYRLTLWYLRRRHASRITSRQWIRHYTLGCLLVGLSWSYIYLFAFESPGLLVQVSLFMLIFGVIGSAVPILSIHFPAFVLYAYPQVLVLEYSILSFNQGNIYFLSIALLLYLVMTTLFSRNSSNDYLATIKLQQQNKQLIGQLEDEVDTRESLVEQRTAELRQSNLKLKGEVAERMKAQDEAHFQFSMLSSVINSTPDLIYYKDYQNRDGAYIGSNQAFADFVGQPNESIEGKKDHHLFGHQRGESIRQRDLELIETGEMQVDENWVTYPDQHEVLLSTLKMPFSDQDDRTVGVLGIGRDITDKKLAEIKLSQERAFLQSVIDGVGDPILVIGEDYRVRLMNQAARVRADGFGLTTEFPTCYQLSYNRDEPCKGKHHSCPLNAVMSMRRSVTKVHQYVDKHGETRTIDLLATPLLDENGDITGIIEASRDITDHRRIQDKLREKEQSLDYIAHHDMLTELPNRLLFMDRLERALVRAKRAGSMLSLLFVDLDHFKEINDSLGHAVGDSLLKEVAGRLQRNLREEDSVARLGGDEFTIVTENMQSAEHAGTLAKKLIDEFRNPFHVDGVELNITISIGISLYPEDGDSAATLLRNADAAMYRTKEEGRNAFRYYTSEMTERAFSRVVMETAVHNAIRQEQFVVYYQPQLELATGRIVGAEALIRWQHPERGLVMPGEFIPVIEQTGQISEVGSWVLSQVCSTIRKWQAEQRPLVPVSINLSARQMDQGSISSTVRKVLAETGCRAGDIELELTESSLMRNPARSILELKALREMGTRISIDDFGTGYSSLSYLKQLPISKLKIDRSFVRDLSVDPNDQAIARAIIALGKSLGLKVVAEGVESEEQRRFLIDQGCNEGQGFYYAPPLPETEFKEFLDKHCGDTNPEGVPDSRQQDLPFTIT